MIALEAEALGRRAEAMLEELAAISAEPDRLVRLFLTPEHRRAAELVAQWMREAGLEVSEDALGNVRGRTGQGPRLLLGSHIDSVIDAGIYDGPLGVVAAHPRGRCLEARGSETAGAGPARVRRRGRLALSLDALDLGRGGGRVRQEAT